MSLTNRLFFAFRPPRALAAEIGRIRDRFGADADGVRDDRLHMTLAITGDHDTVPRGLAERLIEIGDRAASAPIRVALDRVAGSNRSVALRPGKACPALRAFQEQLAAPMLRQGLLRTDWRFSPHVTLFYRKAAPFNRPVGPVAWDCADFVLIHSRVGATRHIELARWPLVARQYALAL